MNALIIDLPVSADLDSDAMSAVSGAGEWHRYYRRVSTGSWGNYQQFYARYIGTKFHDGYLVRHYRRGYTRQRTQTETSYWNQYARI